MLVILRRLDFYKFSSVGQPIYLLQITYTHHRVVHVYTSFQMYKSFLQICIKSLYSSCKVLVKSSISLIGVVHLNICIFHYSHYIIKCVYLSKFKLLFPNSCTISIKQWVYFYLLMTVCSARSTSGCRGPLPIHGPQFVYIPMQQGINCRGTVFLAVEVDMEP